MKNQLRSVEQGADTMVWLGLTTDTEKLAAGIGLFWFDREVVRQHLPLAGTTSSEEDVISMVRQLDEMFETFAGTS